MYTVSTKREPSAVCLGRRVSRIWLFFVPAAPDEPVQKQGSGGSPALCMRAEMGPSAAQRSALAESLGFVDIRVQDCQAELLASTVANIGPFLEDEFSVDGQPMRLRVSNVTITMKVGQQCTVCIGLYSLNLTILTYKCKRLFI